MTAGLERALDPARVLVDPEGCAALETLARRLRSIGYDARVDSDATIETSSHDRFARSLTRLGRGDAIGERDAVDALGFDEIGALERCGALAVLDGEVCLNARIFPMRSVYTVLPVNEAGQEVVYLGPDSLAFFERIWLARGYGDRAIDLGTGNGFIAAALATRYDHVVAADLSARCTSTAALIPVLNPQLRGRFSVVRVDVANGLRRESFDLVTANTPWVPETLTTEGGLARLFAAGGPTGCELPLRFIDEAAALLAPGGRAFLACLDIEFADGRRPLAEHLPTVASSELEVTTTVSPLNKVVDYGELVGNKAPDAIAAQHVVVEIQRRP